MIERPQRSGSLVQSQGTYLSGYWNGWSFQVGRHKNDHRQRGRNTCYRHPFESVAETNIKAKDGLGLRFGHLGKLIVSTFYKKSYYFSMLHDMDKVLIKKVAETKINAAHWKEIERNKYYTLGLVSDRGKGLTEGFKAAFEEKPYYPDHFHEFRDLARIILVELEKRAYKAIAYEDERAKVFDSAKSERVQNKRFEEWEKAVEATEQAIEEYEAYTYLFVCIKANPGLFDKGGNLQDKAGVKEEILTALALMKELSYKKVDGFLLYFEKAKEVYKRVSAQIENKEVLRALCLAWQWDHKVHQSKGAEQKHFSRQERDFWLAYAEGILGQDIESLKESTFSELDTVVRSSSLVEMVNSLIRPYLNTCKGKINKESLNLIMFYHNHRKFNDGKRKGKAPIEILSGKLLKKHWVDILLDDYGDFQDEESKGEAVSLKSEAIGMACAEALQ